MWPTFCCVNFQLDATLVEPLSNLLRQFVQVNVKVSYDIYVMMMLFPCKSSFFIWCFDLGLRVFRVPIVDLFYHGCSSCLLSIQTSVLLLLTTNTNPIVEYWETICWLCTKHTHDSVIRLFLFILWQTTYIEILVTWYVEPSNFGHPMVINIENVECCSSTILVEPIILLKCAHKAFAFIDMHFEDFVVMFLM